MQRLLSFFFAVLLLLILCYSFYTMALLVQLIHY